MDFEDLTCIGKITGTHGLQGLLKVSPLSDYPEYYQNLEQLFIETSETLQLFDVSFMEWKSMFWLLELDGMNRINDVENLVKGRVLIPDTWLKPLETGEFFQHDLIGCNVEDLEGNHMGEIFGIIETGANNVYEVRCHEKEFLIPSVPHVVKSVDMKHRLITVDPAILI